METLYNNDTSGGYFERNKKIAERLDKCENDAQRKHEVAALAREYYLTNHRIRRLYHEHKTTIGWRVILADGEQKITLALVYTRKGFEHACRLCMRHYSGLIGGLELPQWRLEDQAGRNSILLRDLRQQKRGK